MAHAQCILGCKGYQQQLVIKSLLLFHCNNVCMNCLSVMLYVHCQSCYLIIARTERLYLQKLSDNYHLFCAVISTWTEPFSGWIDNFNGPVGLMVGIGKGFIRTVFGDPDATGDCIPADICIQFMLLAAWCKAVGR
jgi:hypothetical protein